MSCVERFYIHTNLLYTRTTSLSRQAADSDGNVSFEQFSKHATELDKLIAAGVASVIGSFAAATTAEGAASGAAHDAS